MQGKLRKLSNFLIIWVKYGNLKRNLLPQRKEGTERGKVNTSPA